MISKPKSVKASSKRKKRAEYAPVAIFAYNRPKHLRMCWQSLARNPEAKRTDLIIFSDGWKTSTDKSSVEKVRDEIRRISGFRSIQPVLRKKNLGLARSIVMGVTRTCKKYGHVIVVEDDLETSPLFLRYMNDGLTTYREEHRVASIHGYTYPVNGRLPENFFLKGADCWGWATWSRAWKYFNWNAKTLLTKIEKNNKDWDFNFYQSYPYTDLLKDNIKNKKRTCAIQWYASCYTKNMYTLYPGKSLIINNGFDSTGVHGEKSQRYKTIFGTKKIKIRKKKIVESKEAKQKIADFFLSLKKQQRKKEKLPNKIINYGKLIYKNILTFCRHLRLFI